MEQTFLLTRLQCCGRNIITRLNPMISPIQMPGLLKLYYFHGSDSISSYLSQCFCQLPQDTNALCQTVIAPCNTAIYKKDLSLFNVQFLSFQICIGQMTILSQMPEQMVSIKSTFLNNCGLLLNGPYFHSFVFLFCLMF